MVRQALPQITFYATYTVRPPRWKKWSFRGAFWRRVLFVLIRFPQDRISLFNLIFFRELLLDYNHCMFIHNVQCSHTLPPLFRSFAANSVKLNIIGLHIPPTNHLFQEGTGMCVFCIKTPRLLEESLEPIVFSKLLWY